MKRCFTILLLLYCFAAHAQTITLTGKIVDSLTQQPLAGASVYIGNSTVGARANEAGVYTLPELARGNYQVLISYVGYHTKLAEITGLSANKTLDFALSSKAVELKEVDIHSNNDWKRNFGMFNREFIGTNNVQECKVLNPEILNMEYTNRRLTVTTDEFLDIENSTLGYKLRFLIKDFWADYNTGKCHYSGTVIFEPLTGKKGDQKKWDKNRLDIYKGSFRHFLVDLAQDKTGEDKFVIRRLTRLPDTTRPPDSLIRAKIKMYSSQLTGRNYRQMSDSTAKWRKIFSAKKIIDKLDKAPLQSRDILLPSTQPGEYVLQFTDYLYIIYRGKHVDMDTDDLFRFNDARDYQIAAISIKGPRDAIVFNKNGILLTKESLFFEGAWNNRIINLLPDDYLPALK